MFCCSICTAKFPNQAFLLSHVRQKHQYCPNFQITCPLGCGSTFKVLSSFTSHLTKKHAHKSTNVNTSSLRCVHCNFVCSKLCQLISHFEFHMKAGKQVECPMKNCNRVYRLKSSLKSHIHKWHKDKKELKINFYSKPPYFSDCAELSENGSESAVAVSETASESQLFSNVAENLDDADRQFALFFLQMQAKYNIPDSTVNFIANGFENFMNQQSLHLRRSLTLNSSTELNPSLGTSFLDSGFFSSMQTSHKRMKYFEKNFQFVKPERYDLGRNQFHSQCSFQYVSLIDSLMQLLLHNDIKEQVFQTRNSVNGIFKDFTDGYFFKSILSASHTSEKNLSILLYFDEFTIVNPIGVHCKKHKIASFYYLLGNLDFHCRSSLNLIQLGIMCRSRDLKYFGLKSILHPLIRDLTILSNGITIPGFGRVTASVPFVCGDNLGSHFLGGFTESFNPSIKHLCRTCMITSDDLLNNFEVDTFQLRTATMYDEQAEAVFQGRSECAEFGIKAKSPLNEIPKFHVITGLPPDAMHDILEGIASYEMVLVLKRLILQGFFTLDYLNRRLMSFPYSKSDATSKPVHQTLLKNALVGTASSNWCFLRLLPLLVGSNVPKDNEYWAFFLELKNIVEVVFAPVLSIGLVDCLQSDIINHLKKFKVLFPASKLKPKHHFLIHYPMHILNYGPPMRYWCFRFEAKHRFFKEVARCSKQFRNPPLTLAKHHQLFQMYCHESEHGFLKSEFECSGVEPILFADVSAATYCMIKRKLNITDSDTTNLFQAKVAKIKGTSYALKMFVVIGFENGEAKFGEIKKIIVYEGNSWFLVKKYQSEKSLHFSSYKLKPLDYFDCIHHRELVDFYPLSGYHVVIDAADVLLITPKYFLLDEKDFMVD